MPGQVRFNDNCSGHDCWPPRPLNEASDNVIVNNRGAGRHDDAFVEHCCEDECHPGSVSSSSTNVFINGKGSARKDDNVSCGSTCDQSSSNVFINGL